MQYILKQPHVLICLLGAGYADYTMSGHDQKIHEMIIEFYGKIKQNWTMTGNSGCISQALAEYHFYFKTIIYLNEK